MLYIYTIYVVQPISRLGMRGLLKHDTREDFIEAQCSPHDFSHAGELISVTES